jgi:hypothetical protein
MPQVLSRRRTMPEHVPPPRPLHGLVRWTACVCLFAGCAGPSMYGPGPGYGQGYGYGQGGYPAGPMGAPVYGGGISNPPPGTYLPGATGAAPVWQPAPGASTGTSPTTQFPVGQDRLVPNYNDPSTGAGGVPPADLGGSGNPLNDPDGDAIKRPTGALPNNAGPNTSALTDPGNERIAALDDQIRLPGALQPASDVTLQPTPNPYEHDRQNFTWLRGVVYYEPQDRVWRMKYDDGRSGIDRYGGDLGLLPNDAYANVFRDQRVHYVEGYVDTRYQDRNGKPMYHVELAERLQPKRN